MTSNAFSAERASFPEARSHSMNLCWTASRRSASLTWSLKTVQNPEQLKTAQIARWKQGPPAYTTVLFSRETLGI